MPRLNYYFGTNSKRHLATCHQDIVLIMNEVIQAFDCSILEGYRSYDLQREYLRRGLSKLDAGASKHNTVPSLAWHAVPWFPTKPHIDWQHHSSMYALGGYILGVADRLLNEGKIEHLVRWGGNWSRTFNLREPNWLDAAHYELVDPTDTFPHIDKPE